MSVNHSHNTFFMTCIVVLEVSVNKQQTLLISILSLSNYKFCLTQKHRTFSVYMWFNTSRISCRISMNKVVVKDFYI